MRATLFSLAALAACSGDTALPIEAQCNPLGIDHCMTPWPSSVFEVDDATSMTGRRLAIPDTTLPINFADEQADPTGWNLADGFSPAAPMVVAFPGGVSAQGLPPAENMDLSLAPDSPTVLIDMTTGTRVAHFAEIDVQADATPDSQALFIRPAARLVGGHRYAVAITNRVKGRDGDDLPIPPGFAALRDGKHTDHSLLEAMRPRFADVLAALDTAGFPKDELVVAWDFTVASDEFLHRDMIAARDRTVAALDQHVIAYTITSDQPGDGVMIKRRVSGTLDAPLFLTNAGTATPGTVIARDGDGLPAMQGWYQIPFTAIVPACAYTSQTPVGMVIYGHGLLGDSSQTGSSVLQTTAAELCTVFVGTDMRGMSAQDVPAVARALNNVTHADEVMEVIEQGIVNHVTLVRAMRTTFAQTLFVDAANANKQLVDPTKVYYYGLSQGGIMGTAVMAYEPTVERAVLGVGAANYSMLLDRSSDWPQYRLILAGSYTDALDDSMIISLCQMRWDKTEGSGIVNTVLAGTPTAPIKKQLLLQIAISDEQVPNIGSYWEARSMGVPVLAPNAPASPRQAVPWGLTTAQSPLDTGASALVIMDGGAPEAPADNEPAPPLSPSMHNLTRNQPATRRQMKEFYQTGQIVNECTGACLCAVGACN